MSPARVGEIMNVSELDWKPVKLPDVVGDLEGLMGFEEIEGVAVDIEHGADDKEKLVKFRKVELPEKPKEEKSKKNRNSQNEKSKKQQNQPQLPDKSLLDAKPTFEGLSEQDEVSLSEWDAVYRFRDEILQGLQEQEFVHPTEIQKAAIPMIMEGKDLIGKAATGSGKTLAFGLPILEKSMIRTKSKDNGPMALIFAPTRELAHQISNHITAASKYTSVSVVSITGGLAIQKQKRLLSYQPDVVVATPGRLHELVMTDTDGLVKWLRKVELLILDEADRLLQDGHFKELEDLLEKLGLSSLNEDEDSDSEDEQDQAGQTRKTRIARQTLVFSATFERDLTRKIKQSSGKSFFSNTIEGKKDTMAYLLDKLNFRKHALEYVDVNPDQAMKQEIMEGLIVCDPLEKDIHLYYFLLKYPGRTIVFVNSIDTVKRLAKLLQALLVPAFAFHSHMIQKQRLRTLEHFRVQENSILISTDVAARGLDIPNIQHVVHYHLPRSADMYVHRSGRTARDQNRGVAVVICSRSGPEVEQLRIMARKLGKDPKKDLQPLDELGDRRVIKQLQERVAIAKQISALELDLAAPGLKAVPYQIQKSGKKGGNDSALLRQGAEDLGLDASEVEDIIAGGDDSDNYEEEDDGNVNKSNSTGLTQKRQRIRAELEALKRELKVLINRPVFTSTSGIRGSFITSGISNVAQQLRDGSGHATFIGQKRTTALDDVSKSRRQRRKKS
ncbi:P-loop containing nucleoside triphosphate hydrolase protein [Lipomyces oligophaga]|uniref:P-loop containing nucleoside triphosphate hydrolase protein n=1 Tax=Lipomyces oligophaga TaxID=45792 RepID=UPI0034CEAA22